MQSWYDIFPGQGNDILGNLEDREGILASSALIEELLDVESKRIGAENIILGGFSQGGAMSLHTGLKYSKKLGGIMSCSGYLLLSPSYPGLINEANSRSPVFTYHGISDPVVSIERARASYALLKKHQVVLESHEERGLVHSLSNPELVAMSAFWTKHLHLSSAKTSKL